MKTIDVQCPMHDHPTETKFIFYCEPNNWRQEMQLPVRQCSECGLIFFSPNLSAKDRKEFHDRNYYVADEKGVVGYPDYFDESHTAAKIYFGKLVLTWFGKAYREAKRKPNSILDLGCATGHMLIPFKDQGWRATGIEFSPFAVNWGVENLGLDLRCQDMDKLGLPKDEKFDCVLCWDSFEHAQFPRKLLRAVYKHSPENMRWIFQLPDVDFYLKDYRHPFWSLYQHSFHYNPDTFRMICEIEGFEVDQELPSSQRGEMLFIVKKKGA